MSVAELVIAKHYFLHKKAVFFDLELLADLNELFAQHNFPPQKVKQYMKHGGTLVEENLLREFPAVVAVFT